jgi:hypothetical protein
MANKIRGETGFEADGKAYTLVFNFNAMCALEGQVGADFATIVTSMRPTHLRALMWAGLQKYHRGVTIDQAGDLVDALGIVEAMRIVGEAVTAAFPAPEADVVTPRDGVPLAAAPATAGDATGAAS